MFRLRPFRPRSSRPFALLTALLLHCLTASAQINLVTPPQPTMGNFLGLRAQIGIGANIPPNTSYAVQWQRDGVNLTNSPHYQGAVTVGVGSTAFGAPTVFINPLLVIPDIQVSDTGTYWAIVYAGGISATSAVSHIAPLTFSSRKPVIRFAADDASVPVGTSFVTFRTQLTASPDCTYQVFKDGVPFLDPVDAKRHGYYGAQGGIGNDGDGFFDFVVSPVTADAAGIYRMVVTGPLGSASTRDIRLSIIPGTPPVITSQPTPAVIGAAGVATKIRGFAASGNPTPTYYYSKDGGPLQLIVGSDLTFSYLLPTDVGSYTLVASNSVSQVSFNPVIVSLTPPTTTPHVPVPVPCIGSVDQLRGAVLKATVSFGVDDHPNPNTYELQFSATANSFTIPAGGYVPAQTVNYTLDLTGSYGKDANGNPVPTLNVSGFKAENGEFVTARFYLFCDDNHLDVWYDAPATLIHHFSYYTWSSLPTVAAGPTITLQPQSIGVTAGARAALEVIATGTEPLSYQWQKNNVDLPGETGRVLVLPSATAAQTGSYRVKVVNGAGTFKFSSPATLGINAALPLTINSQPRSYDYYEGEQAALGIGMNIPFGTQGLLYPQSIPTELRWMRDGVTVKSVLAPFSGLDLVLGLGVKDPNSGFYYITKQETGTYFATATVLGTTTNSAPAYVRVFNDQDAPVFRTYNSIYNLTNTAGAVLVAEVVGTQDPSQKGRLRINRLAYQWKHDGVPIPGANFPYYQIASMDASRVGVYTVVATGLSGASTETGPIQVNLVDPCAPPGTDAVLRGTKYYLTPTTDAAPWPAGVVAIQFGATENTYDVAATTDHGAFSGTWTSQTFGTSYVLTLVGYTFRDGKTGSVSFSMGCSSGAMTYSLSQSVSPFGFQSGTATRKAPVAPKPGPSITTPPAAVSVTAGQPVALSVVADVSDGSAITYQWKRSGVAIPGQRGSSLNFVAAVVSDAGSYSVDVTANGKTVSSGAVQLTVTPGTTSAPDLTLTPFTGGKIAFNFLTTPGVSYAIERKDTLTDTAWITVQTLVGDGAAKQAALDLGNLSGFFRLRILP